MDTYQVTGSAELLYDKCWKILNTDPSFSIQDDVSSFWERIAIIHMFATTAVSIKLIWGMLQYE